MKIPQITSYITSYIQVQVGKPSKLVVKISWTSHFMNECLTQFYLTNLNWIKRNLKFISSPFEVCIKILKSWQAWTIGLQEICMHVCFQHIIQGLWLLLMTLLLRLSSFHKLSGKWVSGTDSDCVIWVNIQRRIKGKIWSSQLSYFSFITY